MILTSGCRSTSSGTAYERHFSAPIWSAAAAEPFEHSPERELLYGIGGLTLLGAPFDSDISGDGAEDHVLTAGKTLPGDALAILLGGAALGYGGWEWGHAGDSRNFEIAAEGLAATEAAVLALKFATQRRRPQGGNHDSFPSGHTAFAFAGATLLARAIEDDTQSRLGYWLYVPALYVGIDRIEAGKHFFTDVGFGALLGIFVADWVHAAHRADAGDGRPVIFDERKPGVAFTVQPYADEESRGLSLGWSF
ncbi:MAG: phosphatase PAP2 family protein [Planctomycetes bacterium]|nr:phosphatase PAP2 family protein [Planctomycetota bacterium]